MRGHCGSPEVAEVVAIGGERWPAVGTLKRGVVEIEPAARLLDARALEEAGDLQAVVDRGGSRPRIGGREGGFALLMQPDRLSPAGPVPGGKLAAYATVVAGTNLAWPGRVLMDRVDEPLPIPPHIRYIRYIRHIA
jgi:hypothetical protein